MFTSKYFFRQCCKGLGKTSAVHLIKFGNKQTKAANILLTRLDIVPLQGNVYVASGRIQLQNSEWFQIFHCSLQYRRAELIISLTAVLSPQERQCKINCRINRLF